MIFKSFIIAIFIASLENKRISSLVGNDENTVNSAGSRPYDNGGGGHLDPEIIGGGDLQKNFFRPFGPQFGLKIKGDAPAGPWPGSATGQTSTMGYLSITPLFLPDSTYIDSCLDLSTTTTSLQRSLSSVPR